MTYNAISASFSGHLECLIKVIFRLFCRKGNVFNNKPNVLNNSLDTNRRRTFCDLEIDGAIQRFEFTFELFWKLLKIYLETQGFISLSPKACFKDAYKIGLLQNQEIVIKMLDDRNLSVHTYDHKISRKIFERIKKEYVNLFQQALQQIKTTS